MTKIPSALSFCAALSLLTFCSKPLPAAPVITGLCNTGTLASVSTCSTPVVGGIDSNYVLTGGTSYVVLPDSSYYNYPLSSWLPNNAVSQWIGPAANQPPCCAPGDYTYSETFTVSGGAAVLVTGQWAADNGATMSIDNGGISTGATTNTFSAWTPFSFIADPGTDTLTFVVDNKGAASGLRVEYNGESVTPEPSTFAALGGGMVIIGLVRRKHLSTDRRMSKY